MNNTIEQQNPWGPTIDGSSSNSKIVNDEGWANFLNDPFASSPMVSIMNQQQQFSKETESTEHVNDDLANKSNNIDEEDSFVANIIYASSPTRNNENDDEKGNLEMVANNSQTNAEETNNDLSETP